ncbi:MAG: hypothetical protein ACKODX_22610 [Gemmata sp.]
MDGPTLSEAHAPGAPGTTPNPRRDELLLEALKVALHGAGEHRLFQSGKLPGLFPSRTGSSSEAALLALRDGLLETVRTEAKGKQIIEWVCATPKAVAFVHEHDSARSILRELRDVLRTTHAAVPEFMAEARAELARLAANFEEKGAAMLSRLDDLAKRCEAALRRAEARVPQVGAQVAHVVPWATAALEYLDRRSETGARGPCPLPELFHALRTSLPGLTLPGFHEGLGRLHDVRAVRLAPAAEMTEPEYAVVVDGKLAYAVTRSL